MQLLVIIFALTVIRGSYSIYCGRNAGRCKHPYHVSLERIQAGKNWEHYCSGTIVGRYSFVTAGHCLMAEQPSYYNRVVAGIVDLDDNSTCRQVRRPVSFSNFYNYERNPRIVDGMIVNVDKPFEFNDYVQAAKLPDEGDESVGEAIATGWGAMEVDGKTVKPKTLQTATVSILPFDECLEAVRAIDEEATIKNTTNICTGPLDKYCGACWGDDGGPLVQDGVLIGVATFGWAPCGKPGIPSIYTKVTDFLWAIKLFMKK